MKVPIACSLSATAARSQVEEWRDVIAATVASVVLVTPTELQLRIASEFDSVDALLRLAQREKACCPFFDFALLIEADALVLRVTVPADAAPILAEFSRGAP
jgi:hypothetical protein